MDAKYVFNNFIGLETLLLEFKVPSMNYCGTYITDEEAISLLYTNKFIFSKAILDNIKKSIKFYFLKYFTAFMNSELEIGELYYGINDDGKVVGFPYMGDFDISVVSNMINTLLNDVHLRTSNTHEKLIDYYSIELIPVSYTYRASVDYYSIYAKQEENNRLIMKEYYRIQKINTNCINLYSTKLVNIIKNDYTRKQLLDYIFHYLEYDNLMLYYHLKKKINNFNTDNIINHEDIQEDKKNKEKVFYWLTRFKDDMLQYVVDNKPRKPHLTKKVNPNCTISMIEPMISNWMNYNPGLKLYMIKLTFYPKKISIDKKDISYKHQGEYIYCTRSIDSFGNPCCIPY